MEKVYRDIMLQQAESFAELDDIKVTDIKKIRKEKPNALEGLRR